MKKILVITTFNNHFHFFRRLQNVLKQFQYETHFLTNKYSIIREAGEANLIIEPFEKDVTSSNEIEVENSFEVAANFIDRKLAINIANVVWNKLESCFSEFDYEYIFMWGGVRLIEHTTSIFASKNNIKTLFFELGNFPNKIFVDSKGTNARSYLAANPSVLLSLPYDLSSFNKWKNNYIQESLKQHSVPQSKSAVNVEYSKNVYDLIGFSIKNFLKTEPILTKEKLVGKYLRNFIKLNFDEIDILKTNYIFFPMQVNKDAQLILNSKVGNLKALEIANQLANEKGLKLLVKPHPGEVEFGFIKKVNKLKEKLGFAFVNNNTIELIQYAKEVITINSTVGLQAKILNKKITCLGKSFYQDFDEQMLAAYIQSYLIDADFWNESTIPIETVEQIFERAKLN